MTAAARHPENIIKLDGVTSDKLDLHADVEDITKQVKVLMLFTLWLDLVVRTLSKLMLWEQ